MVEFNDEVELRGKPVGRTLGAIDVERILLLVVFGTSPSVVVVSDVFFTVASAVLLLLSTDATASAIVVAATGRDVVVTGLSVVATASCRIRSRGLIKPAEAM